MFRSILVPIDFSETASHALRLAIRLARESQGHLTLLHVGLAPGLGALGVETYGVPVPDTFVQLHEELAKERQHALDRLAGEEVPADVPYITRVREGYAPDEIVAEAKTGKHDLLVIGTHGRTGVGRVLLGSVTERVLRHAEIPVLVTR
jgi:nucleotide-binding universal stress UspA family protein